MVRYLFMSLNASELGLRKTGDPKDKRFADKIAKFLNARGSDIPLPESTPSQATELLVRTAVVELPRTPDTITNTFASFWHERTLRLKNAGVPLDPTFEPCPFTQEEIDEPGTGISYLPPELATQEQRYLLGLMFPQMQSHSVKIGNTVNNEADRSGWFKYESVIDAPHRNTTEDALRIAVENEGRLGMNLNEYIIASQDSKVLTGKYLDQTSTAVRLLGSRCGGRVVDAGFDDVGSLNVRSTLYPQDHGGRLGGRSVRLPKAA